MSECVTNSPPGEAPSHGWHILGAGAVGCLWAARLSQSGASVRLILRNEERLREFWTCGGITLEADGLNSLLPMQAECIGESGPGISQLLVTTKAQDLRQALEQINSRLVPGAEVLLLQNGIEAQQQASRDFPDLKLYCLVSSHGAYLKRRFHVVHAGKGEAWLGKIGGGAASEAGTKLLSRLPFQSMAMGYDGEILPRLWRKLAINCAMNALTVIYQCRNGGLLHEPLIRERLRSLCEEIERILRTLPDAPVFKKTESETIVDEKTEAETKQETLYNEVVRVARRTAKNYSSTLQDYQAGRAHELSGLNGYLCRRAEKEGLPHSLNSRVLHEAEQCFASARKHQKE